MTTISAALYRLAGEERKFDMDISYGRLNNYSQVSHQGGSIYIAFVFLVSLAGKLFADHLRRRYGLAAT